MGDIRRLLTQLTRGALFLAFLFVVAVATAGISSPLFFAIMLSAGFAIAAIQVPLPIWSRSTPPSSPPSWRRSFGAWMLR